ncbi:hypothetical protein [Streptomyces sp. NPDC058155]
MELPHLRHEQRDRLSCVLGRMCDTDWAAVRAGARALAPVPPP